MQQPTMFCHDSTNIYYPTAPGRVYIIAIAALADCDGGDEDYVEETTTGGVADMIFGHRGHGLIDTAACGAPPSWPGFEEDVEEADADFFDALEQWADWCDRDSVRLDSLDEIRTAIRAA